MSKQSSVEWLFVELWNTPKDKFEWQSIFEQAKAMHREEIKEAHYDGSIITLLNPDGDMLKLSEQYYKETFGDEKEVL